MTGNATSMQPALRLSHVYKKFSRGEYHDSLRDLIPSLVSRFTGQRRASGPLRQREFWALNDISFDVAPGESVAIIGHNGAGKSTMLKHLCGIMRPTSGDIITCGRLAALIEVGAGFHGDLTGRENIYLNGVILGMTRAEIRRKFDDIVQFSGLEEFLGTPVKRYSSGMYARLGFSVAAHIEPDILIVDEVLSVGDMLFQARSLEKMKAIVRGGATVIFVSHNLQAVSDLCDRAILLDRGQLISDGSTDDVVQQYIRRVQLGRPDLDKAACRIDNAEMSGSSGPRVAYKTGEDAELTVTYSASKPIDNIAVVVWIVDETGHEIFATSTQRLGMNPISLDSAEKQSCRFRLTLHLAPGTYRVNVALHQYATDSTLDAVTPATTFVITTDTDISGCCNLYPRAYIGGT